MHIVVEKIITLYKKDSDGNVIKSPANDNRPVVEGLKTVIETIRMDEIKAARSWVKSKVQEESISGPITSIYMLDIDRHKGGDSKRRPAEIHIAEGLESFNRRIGAVPLG